VAVIRRAGGGSSDRIHFSPDGKTVAIGGFRRVQLWDVSGLDHESQPPD
jgi:hypothetical protein